MEKVFCTVDFDDPSQKANILQIIPAESLENKILTRDEEFHLFRKMNYLKYLGKKDEAVKIRNILSQFNFGLAKQLLKNKNCYQDRNTILSDAYLDIIKSVDYFDYRLGNKFSTYATWVIKKNYYRSLKQKKQIFQNVEFEKISETNSSENYDFEKIIDLLTSLKESNCKDSHRKHYIVQSYFGINCDRKSLLELSSELGISKERVRQIKEKAVAWLSSQIKEICLEVI